MSKPQCIRKTKDNILKRPRLFDILDNSLSSPLIWINAPAGSGKSTLVDNYLETRKLACLWYSCTEEDNNLTSFFHYLGSLHKKTYPIQKGKLPRLQAKQKASVTTFGKVFFKKLFSAFLPPSILVFDDFHRIDVNSKLHAILCNALAYLPNDLNIIIISRDLPSSIYTRLHAAHKISEISAQELMFTHQETEGLVQLIAPHKTTEKQLIKIWQNKTQGWVTGLMLLLESLRSDCSLRLVADEVVQEYIFDYFSGEYFDALEQTTKEFLVVTNLLPSFSRSQSQALTGYPKARQVLHDMVSRQFITFQRDNFQLIYHFHPLLRDFLQFHLNEFYTDTEILFFKNKAAGLLEKSGQLSNSATLYQQANNHDALSQLLLKYASIAYQQGNVKCLQHWISSLPTQTIEQEPWLAYWFGMATIQLDPIMAKIYFKKAVDKFIQVGDAKGAYRGWAGVANSYVLALHSFKGARQWMGLLDELIRRWPDFPDMETQGLVTFSALDLLVHISADYKEIKKWAVSVEKLSSIMPIENLSITTNQGLVVHNNISGHIGKIRKLAAENHTIFTNQQASLIEKIAASVGVISSASLTQLSDNIDVLAVADKGLNIAVQNDCRMMDSLLLIQSIQFLLQANEIEKAKKYLRKLQKSSGIIRLITRVYYNMMASHIEAEQGNHSTALVYLTEALEIVKEHAPKSIHELFCRAVLALQLSELKKYDKAAKQIAKAEQLSLGLKSKVGNFMIACFKARAALLQKDNETAVTLLKHGLRLARRREITGFGHWRPYMMTDLLQFALEQGIEVEYVVKLIRLSNITPKTAPLHIPYWPWAVKVVTLGSFKVYIQGELLTFKRKAPQKPLELLKAIVALGGKDIPIESLMDRVWPDSEGDAAKSVFDSTLQRLRRLLKNDKALSLHETHISLNPLYCWTDTQALEQVIEEFYSENCPDKLEQAVKKILELYQGEFLKGEQYPWILQHRQQLQIKVVRSLETICKKISGNETCKYLDEILERILEISPYSEVFYQRLMQFYIEQGRMSDSVLVYRRCEEVFERKFGFCPSLVSRKLYLQALG